MKQSRLGLRDKRPARGRQGTRPSWAGNRITASRRRTGQQVADGDVSAASGGRRHDIRIGMTGDAAVVMTERLIGHRRGLAMTLEDTILGD